MFMDLMSLVGFSLPWSIGDLERFDQLLVRYRALPLPDQIVFRRSLLWHVLGLSVTTKDDGSGGEPCYRSVNDSRQPAGDSVRASG
ncbi:MAG: hypothetical protein EBZ89_06495 [Chloroflexi bacterium]|nr:hypothetical protein [Chloroflexota bacterium]